MVRKRTRPTPQPRTIAPNVCLFLPTAVWRGLVYCTSNGGRGRGRRGRLDRLATEATSARKLVDHLDEAMLAKAFRGELVAQDPNDEPASVLLDRLKAERTAGAEKAQKRGRRSART
jgi:hypothetical protein